MFRLRLAIDRSSDRSSIWDGALFLALMVALAHSADARATSQTETKSSPETRSPDAVANASDADANASDADASKAQADANKSSAEGGVTSSDAANDDGEAASQSSPLAFVNGLTTTTPKASTLSQVFLDQMREAGFETKDVPGALGDAVETPCADLDCFLATTKREGGKFAVVGAITPNGAFDILNVVIIDHESKAVIGRIREEGRSETAYIQRSGDYATRLIASAKLAKNSKPLIYFGIFHNGTPLDINGRKPPGRRFPVLSAAGGVVTAVGVLLVGIGVLFGITANANQTSALGAATQVEAAAYLDQRDINGFFANGLFLTGTVIAVAGAGALGLGLAWGE